MTKIPFNIKYRPQIESGEYRVVTREDRPAEIKIWDLKGDFPVVGVYYDDKNNRDTAVQVTAEGRCSIKPGDDYCDDFFIITGKLEPTEFEENFLKIIRDCNDSELRKKYQVYFKEASAILLEVASKQLKRGLPLSCGTVLERASGESAFEYLERCLKPGFQALLHTACREKGCK